jgi:uncharacterized protein (DUF58 family)
MRKTNFIGDVFINNRFFLCWGIIGILFLFSYFFSFLLVFSKLLMVSLAFLTLFDYVILFVPIWKIYAIRKVQKLWSNGDENTISLRINNTYPIKLKARIVDEIPFQFQQRDFELVTVLKPNFKDNYSYTLRPTLRGEYHFGELHLFVSTLIGLVERRYTSMKEDQVKVYPSYIQIKNFQIQTIPDVKAQAGGRTTYRRGASSEFDHIKEYNRGDDVRTINWKASARRNQLMVNSYMDEKSQSL